MPVARHSLQMALEELDDERIELWNFPLGGSSAGRNALCFWPLRQATPRHAGLALAGAYTAVVTGAVAAGSVMLANPVST